MPKKVVRKPPLQTCEICGGKGENIVNFYDSHFNQWYTRALRCFCTMKVVEEKDAKKEEGE